MPVSCSACGACPESLFIIFKPGSSILAAKRRKRPIGRFAFMVLLMPQNYQTTPIAPSGGRAELLWRGLSDMDVARAAMGQGRPFAASPRNNDGAREPQRSWGRMPGLDLLVSFGAMPKETRSTERNRTYPQRDKAGKPQLTHSVWDVKSSRLKPLPRIAGCPLLPCSSRFLRI